MNKKFLLLTVFLVLALFVISACEDAVGRRIIKNKQSTISGIINGCNIQLFENVDLTSDTGISGLSAVSTLYLKPIDASNYITLTKTKNDETTTIKTNEVWLYNRGNEPCVSSYGRESDCSIYKSAIFYKDSTKSNKKSVFESLTAYDGKISINC